MVQLGGFLSPLLVDMVRHKITPEKNINRTN